MRISDWSSDVCSSDLRDFAGLAVASHGRGFGRELRQRLDRLLGASHRVTLKRMAKAEQEQQQRAFGPCAQRSGAGGSNQHQRVDLELLHPKVVVRLAPREEPAEEIGIALACRGKPLTIRRTHVRTPITKA